MVSSKSLLVSLLLRIKDGRWLPSLSKWRQSQGLDRFRIMYHEPIQSDDTQENNWLLVLVHANEALLACGDSCDIATGDHKQPSSPSR